MFRKKKYVDMQNFIDLRPLYITYIIFLICFYIKLTFVFLSFLYLISKFLHFYFSTNRF